MARDIKEIAEELKKSFIGNALFQRLYGIDVTKTWDEQFKEASIETILLNIFATASATVENLVEMRKNEIDRIVMQERYGYKGWYERMMRAFQWGDNVNELEEQTYYETIDESKQIIKFAYCEEKGNGILLKIAKADVNEEPEPLSIDEYNAALVYINRIKPAGISVELRSEIADELEIILGIRYNSLLFASEDQMKTTLETTIKGYLKSLEYNGAFVGMKMIDFLQAVSGIEIAQINSVQVTHVAYPAEDVSSRLSYTPYSGHLKLKELSIQLDN
ncbi:MAG: hypothetical protein LBL58_19190 [Tannerellaceae bacterium]|jgi:hypothetical protein|nr:hypothetical protein [Tannerellaceae bacterium]